MLKLLVIGIPQYRPQNRVSNSTTPVTLNGKDYHKWCSLSGMLEDY